MNTAETIRTYIRQNMVIYEDDDSLEFHDDDNIFTKGFVNSLFATRLVTFIEDEFSLIVDNEDLDLENFSSVTKIVEFVNRKRI